jgi:hypothetical protein
MKITLTIVHRFVCHKCHPYTTSTTTKTLHGGGKSTKSMTPKQNPKTTNNKKSICPSVHGMVGFMTHWKPIDISEYFFCTKKNQNCRCLDSKSNKTKRKFPICISCQKYVSEPGPVFLCQKLYIHFGLKPEPVCATATLLSVCSSPPPNKIIT